MQVFNVKFVFITIVVFLFLTSSVCFGQNDYDIKFDRITSENYKIIKGLSQNTANCIIQDSKGFIWIGTWDGLNRYDGYSFLTYKSSVSNNTNQLSNQTINALFEDSEGIIWVGTETGLNSYNRKNQEFIQYKKKPDQPFCISSDTIWCIAQENKDILWVGTNNGLNKFDKRTGYFYNFKLNPNNANSLCNNVINCILIDKNKNIWVGTEKGLTFYNQKDKIFSHFYHNKENTNSVSSDFINDLMFDSNGFLWICTSNGLNKYNLKTKTFSHHINNPAESNSISNNNVTCVMEDTEKNIWIGTYGGGVNLLNTKSNKIEKYSNNIYNERSISNDYINEIYQDRSGIIWIATAWKGINKIDRYSNRFKHFYHFSDDNRSLNHNNVWAIIQDKKGKIWIATDKGINIMDTASGTFSFLKHNPTYKNSIPSNLTRVLFQDSKGQIWIGTFDAGVCVYDESTHNFKLYQNNPDDLSSLSYNRINYFFEDSRNNIWIATDNGLNLFLPEKNKFRRFLHDPDDANSISNNVVYYIHEDNQKKIWLSTLGGINIYDPSTGHFKAMKKNPEKFQSLSSDKIFSTFEDSEGYLWVATCGGGLNRFNKNTGEIIFFTEEDGLSNNVVYNIFEDSNSNLWITTNYGLSKYNKKSNTFINYDVKDGIQSNEFNLNACYKNPYSGEIFIGGMNGFNAFIPEKVLTNTYIPPVVISSVKINDRSDYNTIENGDTLYLSFDNSFFSIQFSALDFSNPSKNKYSYILEGYDDKWLYTDAYKNFCEYTQVNPGIYTFRVKGSNGDAVWNNTGMFFTIIVSTPWYQTWWFIFITVIIIGSIITYLVYMRMKNIQIKHEGEKQILEIEKQMFSLEQTALRLQMNPHFIFNSLNSIQSFVIANDTDKAIHYLAKFSQLMRFILSHSQQSFVPIADEIKAMSIYLDIERLRFDFKFTYDFKIDPAIDTEFTEIPPMIIQPYIENAIIHGILNKEGSGHISISVGIIDEKFLLCTIEDNGIGREKALLIRERSDLKHKSKGMMITQKRLDILNERSETQKNITITDLKDENNQASGTKVEVVIVYKEN